VLKEAERLAVVETIRWVDEVIQDVPYDLNEAWAYTRSDLSSTKLLCPQYNQT